MKIVVVTLARNEEKIIPYFINHYAKIADKIVVFDHESTDKTVDIARQTASDLSVELEILTHKNNGYDEYMLSHFKENAYKLFPSYDVALVVDADEFFYHPDGTRQQLEKLNHNFVVKPQGYQMVSESFPRYTGVSLTELVKDGFRDAPFDKKCAFSSNLVLKISMGMHESAHFDGVDLVPPQSDLGFMLLHYKLLGEDHRAERIKSAFDNITEAGLELAKNGISVQLTRDRDNLKQDFDRQYAKKARVLQ